MLEASSSNIDFTDLSPSQRAYHHLVRALRDGSIVEGGPLPSEHTLAKRCGVSRTSIRSALQQLASEKSIEQRDNKWVAAGAKEVSVLNKAIGIISAESVVMEDRQASAQGWSNYIQQGVMDRVSKEGYFGMTLTHSLIEPRDVRALAESGLHGCIMLYNCMRTDLADTIIKQWSDIHVPIVLQDEDQRYPHCHAVYSDHDAGAYDVCNLMLSRGRRHIVPCFQFAPRETPSTPLWAQQRLKGYARACEHNQYEILDPFIYEVGGADIQHEADFEWWVSAVSGQLVSMLNTHPDVDGVMCLTDSQAMLVAEALARLGKAPGKDIDVVGYDNYGRRVFWSQFCQHPVLATVDKANARLGAELVATLQEVVDSHGSGQGPIRRAVKPQLCVLHA